MPRSKPYHHENLRETLIEAAVALVGEVGPRAFTLREVARRAGVSHNAPYRHFAAKSDLLAAVASEGFERLTASMRKWMGKGTTAMERLHLSGCGYVDFALRWPNHFQVMFDVPRDLPECPPEDEMGRNAFQVLVGAIVEAQQSGDLAAGDPLPLAFIAWGMVHGVAKLGVNGNLPMNRAATLEFTGFATRVLADGLRNVGR